MCRIKPTILAGAQALLLTLITGSGFAAPAGPSVLPLRSVDAGGRILARHSATVLGPELAVTRCNLIDGPFDGSLTLQLVVNTGLRPAQVRARDEARDLCLLTADLRDTASAVPEAAPLPLAASPIQALSRNHAGQALNPAGTLEASPSDQEAGALKIPLEPGAGGGAVLNEQGQLLGILAEPAYRGQATARMAPAIWIAEIEARSLVQKDAVAARQTALRLWSEAGDGQRLAQHCQEWTTRMPNDAQAWYWLGLSQMRLGRAAEAEASLNQAFALNPDDQKVRDGIGQALLLQEKHEAARQWAQAGVSQGPQQLGRWLALGQTELTLGHDKEAQAAYRRALQLAPWSHQASLALLSMARKAGDLVAEREGLQTLLGQNPASAQAWQEVAETYLRLNQFPAAAASIAQMENLEGETVASLSLRAQMARRTGDIAQAIALLQQAIRLSPKPQQGQWLRLAQYNADALVVKPALGANQMALALAPQAPEARAQLITLLLDDGKIDEAARRLDTEPPASPSAAWVLRAHLAERQGDFPKAVTAYQEALKLTPDQPEFLHDLARSAVWSGQGDVARSCYEKLQKLDPAWAELTWNDAIRVLEALP